MAKTATIFDHLAGITYKKTPWESLSEADRKSFSPYLINRWLSMNEDLIEYVDAFQQYTIGPLSVREVYKLYLDLLPKQRFRFKYIKGKKVAKYNNDLVKLLAEHFELSKAEATQYVEILCEQAPEVLYDIVYKYGKTEKEIKSMIRNR
jgi:hypothetical protein